MQNKDKNCINVHIYPNSKKTEFVGFNEDKKRFIFRIKAKPTEGKANEELLKFIKKEFKVTATIIRGHKNRDKVIALENMKKPFKN